MNSTIRASVLIVTYNSEQCIEECLNSVLTTLPENCEVVVVDNASSDRTTEIIASQFPTVRVIANSNNTGFATGMNQAARESRGQILVPLNPDAAVTNGWLDALVGPLENPEAGERPVGATTPRILLLQHPANINACGNVVHITGVTTCRGLGELAGEARYSQACDVAAISGACFAVRRHLWNELEGLNDRYFMYLEDTDLSLRMHLAGFALAYVPTAIVYHDYKNSFSAQKFYYLERNRLRMLLTAFRPRVLLGLIPALLLAEIMAWTFSMSRGGAFVASKMRSYATLRKELRAIASARKNTKRSAAAESRLLSHMSVRLEATQLTGSAFGRALAALTLPVFAVSRALAVLLART